MPVLLCGHCSRRRSNPELPHLVPSRADNGPLFFPGHNYRLAAEGRVYREGKKVRKRTLANLSSLSDEQIESIRAVLSGQSVRPVEQFWQTIRSRPHGAVQAVRVAMQRLGFESLLASRLSAERDDNGAIDSGRVDRGRGYEKGAIRVTLCVSGS